MRESLAYRNLWNVSITSERVAVCQRIKCLYYKVVGSEVAEYYNYMETSMRLNSFIHSTYTSNASIQVKVSYMAYVTRLYKLLNMALNDIRICISSDSLSWDHDVVQLQRRILPWGNLALSHLLCILVHKWIFKFNLSPPFCFDSFNHPKRVGHVINANSYIWWFILYVTINLQ